MRPTPSDGARADDSANRDQNARPSGSFFGESLDGLVQVGAALRGRGALWHCCPPERAAERIGRALEEPIALAKTETRLSRNLGRPELGDHVGRAVLRAGSRKVGARTLLILDVSDIAKPYAEKMQYLARVRDGSTGAIADGYWLCQVVAVENEDSAIVPLMSTLYSQAAPDFVSENAELKAAMAAVAEACAGRGVWVVDRGGDRSELYADLLAARRSFVIRQKGDRHLHWGLRTIETARLAADCPLSHATRIVRQDNGQEVSCRLDYGCRPVRLPEHPDQRLWLVVVRGLGAAPMMLLTDLPMRRNRKVLWWVVSAYLTRWRIEEAIRFVKQSYDLEDIRVLTYQRLRNLAVFVNAVAFFTAVVLGTRIKLEILATHLVSAAKRLFGIPDFRLYALADGIRAVCARSPRRPQPTINASPQFSLRFR